MWLLLSGLGGGGCSAVAECLQLHFQSTSQPYMPARDDHYVRLRPASFGTLEINNGISGFLVFLGMLAVLLAVLLTTSSQEGRTC